MLRNLPLNLKVTVTLVAVFSLIVVVFLVVLYPFQQRQIDDLLEFNESVLGNLERVYRNRLIYDLIGEIGANESLAVSLQDLMAVDSGILFAKIVDPEGGLFATTDVATIAAAVDEARANGRIQDDPTSLPSSGGANRPVMLRRVNQPTRVFAYDGGSYRIEDDRLSRDLQTEVSQLGRPGLERRTVSGQPALVLTQSLEAADVSYGTLQLAYSLAIVERNKRRTSLIFYGLIATIFIILLLLLNLIISRIVIAPLRTVFRGMRAVGSGDLEQRLETTSRDEIGEMSSIFNQMVAKMRQSKRKIEQYSRDLERRVSERTRKLRESEDRMTHLKNYLAAVIDNVGTGVLSVDREGAITTFNDRAEEILELDWADVAGRTTRDVFADDGLAPLGEAIEAVDETGVAGVREIELRLPRGKRTLSLKATRLGVDGDDLGKVVVFDDVTDMIYSKKLSAWKEAVEKVIHEIKNPLTPIRLSTQQLRKAFEDRSPVFEQMFDRGTRTILASVENLQQLVSDFSAFYRLHPVALKPADVNEMIEEVLPMYAENAPEGVRVNSELGPGMPPIAADGGHLKRVFANLVQNGIDAMEGREGTVTVRTEYRAERGRVAVLVEDQGKGMSPEEMEKVFEPYYTTKIKGTGLGLIISKQIIEDHHGEIKIRSKLERGTRVELLFPAVAATAADA